MIGHMSPRRVGAHHYRWGSIMAGASYREVAA
jgi:hypothetical protein